jgi:hypothetical protein
MIIILKSFKVFNLDHIELDQSIMYWFIIIYLIKEDI